MLSFSSLLKTNLQYSLSAENLFSALSVSGEKYTLFEGTRDIWARDYMPVRTKSGQYISFRYKPNYVADDPQLRTNFKADIAPHFTLPVTYSNINLDGGNVVFSPSKKKAVITDRVFSENTEYDKNTLLLELENLLETEIIIIPSLKSDMTGHADGVVRFVNENTVVGNASVFCIAKYDPFTTCLITLFYRFICTAFGAQLLYHISEADLNGDDECDIRGVRFARVL